MSKAPLTEGMKLWFVPSHRSGSPYEVTVTRVGRKWAEIDGSYHGTRADRLTWAIDGRGYIAPGVLWPSKHAFEEEIARQTEWRDVMRSQNVYHAPDGVTRADIAAIKAILERATHD